MTDLTPRQRQVLEFIDAEVRHRGYPPSVREIGEAVGLSSSSTVHAHLAALQDKGYLTRDPTKPRALELHLDIESGQPIERRPVRHVPLVGDVAAGTGVLAAENIEETLPVPEDFTGDGVLFMLRVRGDSMIEAGIFDGDYVVVRQQPDAQPGDTVIAGIPAKRRRSRRSCAAATRSCCGRRTPRWRRWSSTRATSRSTARSSRSSVASDRRTVIGAL